jgi:hypothetical protein
MLFGCFLALRLCHPGLLMRFFGVRLRMGRMLICLGCVTPPMVLGGVTMGLRRGFVILSGSYMIFLRHTHLLSARDKRHAGGLAALTANLSLLPNRCHSTRWVRPNRRVRARAS